MGSSGHQVTPACKDVPGQSWDVTNGILRTSSHPSLQGCPRTVLGCPSWDPPDIKSPQLERMSQDSPGMSLLDIKSCQLARMSQDSTGMSLMGPSGHQVTPASKDVPGQSLMGSSGHQITPASKDVPHGILRSHPSLQGCPRTVLGYPSWDPPDIKLPQLERMSQDSPGMSLLDIKSCQLARMSQDSTGMSDI